MPEATQKMLTQQLRELEHDGIVVRKVYHQVPPKVEYSLTAMGRRCGRVARLVQVGRKARGTRAEKSGLTICPAAQVNGRLAFFLCREVEQLLAFRVALGYLFADSRKIRAASV